MLPPKSSQPHSVDLNKGPLSRGILSQTTPYLGLSGRISYDYPQRLNHSSFPVLPLLGPLIIATR